MKLRLICAMAVLCAAATASFGQEMSPPDLFANRGMLNLQAGDFESAEAAFKRSLSIDTKNVQANFGMGMVSQNRKDHASAIRYLTTAIESASKVAKSTSMVANFYASRANSYGSETKFAAAVEDMSTAIRMEPEFANHYAVRAWFNLFLMKNNEAYNDAVTAFGKGSSMPIKAVVIAYLAMRRTRNAAALKSIIDILPPDVPSVLQFLRGDIKAPAFIASAGSEAGKLTEAHAIIGEIALIDGDKKSALEHFQWVKAHGSAPTYEYQLALSRLTPNGK